MHPYLFRIPLRWGGTFPIASYGVMILFGFLVSLWLLLRRGRRMGLNPTALFDAATFGLLGGILGARLFYVIDHWEQFADGSLPHLAWRTISIWQGGLAFYGGLIGGAVGLLATVWTRRLPLRATLDVVGSLIPLGHAFGRVGCFLNGCCYGRITDSWLGVRFPRILVEGAAASPLLNVDGHRILSPAFGDQVTYGWSLEAFDRIRECFNSGFVEEFRRATVLTGDRYVLRSAQEWSLPVHPTQLYAVAYNLVIFALLSYVLWRRWRPGEIGWLYLIFYGTARFANEFVRGDTVPIPSLGGLTLFQAISAAAVAFGLVMLFDTRRRPRLPLPAPWPASSGPDEVKKRS